jgi:hypothetical protein
MKKKILSCSLAILGFAFACNAQVTGKKTSEKTKVSFTDPILTDAKKKEADAKGDASILFCKPAVSVNLLKQEKFQKTDK